MSTNSFLFVYGTLMRGCKSEMGRFQRRRLLTESVYVGPAYTHGLLYDLGNYPALKAPKHLPKDLSCHELMKRCGKKTGESLVFGEVVRLTNARRSFFWIDAFKGINPREKADKTMYHRARDLVVLDRGNYHQGCKVRRQVLDAWLYVFQFPAPRARIIANGRWRYVKGRR